MSLGLSTQYQPQRYAKGVRPSPSRVVSAKPGGHDASGSDLALRLLEQREETRRLQVRIERLEEEVARLQHSEDYRVEVAVAPPQRADAEAADTATLDDGAERYAGSADADLDDGAGADESPSRPRRRVGRVACLVQ